MSNHLFISSDGHLYDTNDKEWSKMPPLRRNYKYHHADIFSAADFKSTVRAGPYAWPGGYPLYFTCEDGEPLCFKCARLEAKAIIEAIHKLNINDGWRVIGCGINYEDEKLICVNCEKSVESAYGKSE